MDVDEDHEEHRQIERLRRRVKELKEEIEDLQRTVGSLEALIMEAVQAGDECTAVNVNMEKGDVEALLVLKISEEDLARMQLRALMEITCLSSGAESMECSNNVLESVLAKFTQKRIEKTAEKFQQLMGTTRKRRTLLSAPLSFGDFLTRREAELGIQCRIKNRDAFPFLLPSNGIDFREMGYERRAVLVGVNTFFSITPDVIQLSLQAPYESFVDERLPTKVSDQASAAVLGYVLYVSGIGQDVKEIWRWDVISGWARCCDLICGRQRHCSSFVGTTLYLLGGITKSDKEVVGTIERFDTVANVCQDVSSLSHPIQAAACVSHGTTIYVFGGLNSEIQTVDYVQAFDTIRETCNIFSPSMPCSNFLLRPALWDNCVIMMGADTCLIFDILRHTWQERRNFKAEVMHFGMAVENQRLYVFGGGTYVTPSEPESKTTWVCTDRVKSVSVGDIILDRQPVEWTEHGSLLTPCLVHAFAVVTLPKK